jgi:hypothetical protein
LTVLGAGSWTFRLGAEGPRCDAERLVAGPAHKVLIPALRSIEPPELLIAPSPNRMAVSAIDRIKET